MAQSKLEILIQANANPAVHAIGAVGQALSGVGGAFSRISEFVTGFLIGKLIVGAFNMAKEAVEKFISTSFNAVAVMQRLAIQIQTLQAREMANFINAGMESAIIMQRQTKEGTVLRLSLEEVRKVFAGMPDEVQRIANVFKSATDSGEGWVEVLHQGTGAWVTASELFDVVEPKAKATMDQLARIAIFSPYTLENANAVYKLALAFQFTSDQAMRMTEGMLNVAAGTGATNEMLERMTFNFAQIKMQGKIMARDFWELGKAGFDLYAVLKQLEKQTGVTMKTHLDFNAALASGKVTWEDFVTAFQTMADEQFGGAAKRMSFTITGIQSTLKDFFFVIMPKLFGPAADSIGKFAEKWFGVLTELASSGKLEAIGAQIKTWLDGRIADFDFTLNEITIILDRIKSYGFEQGLGYNKLLNPEWNTGNAWVKLGAIIDDLIVGMGIAKKAGEGLQTLGGLIGQAAAPQKPGKEGAMEGGAVIPRGPIERVATLLASVDLEDFMPPELAGIATAVGNALNWVGRGILTIGQFIKAHKTDIDSFVTALKLAFLIFVSFGAMIWVILKPALEFLKDALSTLFTEENISTWIKILSFIAGVVVGMIAIIAGGFLLIGGILLSLSVLVLGFVMKVFSYILGLIQNIETFWNELAGTTLGEKLQSLLAWVQDAIALFVGTVTDLIMEFIGKLKTKIEEIIESIRKTYNQWFEAGKYMVGGLWAGVKERWNVFKNWIVQKAREIIDAIMDVFDEHSPSGVFAGIGKNLVLGLEQGVMGESSILSNIASSFGSVIPDINGSVTVGNKGIADSLSGALQSYQDRRASLEMTEREKQHQALIFKIDSLIMAVQNGGSARDNARAIAEAMQLAEIR